MMYDVTESIVGDFHTSGDYDGFKLELIRHFSIESPVSADEFKQMNDVDMVEKIYEILLEAYKRKQESISEQAMPVINQVYETQRQQYENIVVPVSDGARVFQVLANLENCYNSKGKELLRSYEKSIILATID